MKENQIPPTYSSPNFFIFLSLQFCKYKKKNSRSFFLRDWEAQKVETWSTRGQQVDVLCILQSGCWRLFIPSFLHFYFLSNFKTLNFLSHFSVRSTKLKLNTHMGEGLICCVHQLQADRIYLFLYFSSFFSVSLAKIRNLLLQNCFWWLRPGVCELCLLSAIFLIYYSVCQPTKRGGDILFFWCGSRWYRRYHRR